MLCVICLRTVTISLALLRMACFHGGRVLSLSVVWSMVICPISLVHQFLVPCLLQVEFCAIWVSVQLTNRSYCGASKGSIHAMSHLSFQAVFGRCSKSGRTLKFQLLICTAASATLQKKGGGC